MYFIRIDYRIDYIAERSNEQHTYCGWRACKNGCIHKTNKICSHPRQRTRRVRPPEKDSRDKHQCRACIKLYVYAMCARCALRKGEMIGPVDVRLSLCVCVCFVRMYVYVAYVYLKYMYDFAVVAISFWPNAFCGCCMCVCVRLPRRLTSSTLISLRAFLDLNCWSAERVLRSVHKHTQNI